MTLRTRGSTVYRLFRQKVPFAGARTSHHEHVFWQTWRWMKVDIFLMHLNFYKYYKFPLLRLFPDLLKKYFSHPSLVIYSFATPPIKVKLGQQIGGGTMNSKPLAPIIMMGQSKILSSSQIPFITLFSPSVAVPCTSHTASKLVITPTQNHFLEPNHHILSFLHPIFLCRITY